MARHEWQGIRYTTNMIILLVGHWEETMHDALMQRRGHTWDGSCVPCSTAWDRAQDKEP